MRPVSFLLFVSFFLAFPVLAQERMTQQEYIEQYHDMAVRKMHEFGIPASITLAQGILESASGNSQLAKNARNHFGIKCHSDWTGDGYYMDDDEADECFRVYASVEESYADHSRFLSTRSRYKFLFTDYDVTDYKGWAHGLKKAGYATNPKYPQLLISIIEKHGLYTYDRAPYPVDNNPPLAQNDVPDVNPTNDVENLPKGVFTFNRAKAVAYKGESDMELAVKHDIDVNRLRKYNDRYMGEPFQMGQMVFLQPKRRRGADPKHVVKEGQSLWQISQMQGIRLAKLLKRNGLEIGDEVAPGQTLYLRKKNPDKVKTITWRQVEEDREEVKPVLEKPGVEKPKPVQKPRPSVEKPKPPRREEVDRPATHTVQAGETLYSISMRYYVTVDELKTLNGLENNVISIGQVLRLK